MPGIAGIVDFDKDKASIDKEIRRMVKILNHTSPSDEEIYVSDHAALGAVRLKAYSFHDLVAADEDTLVVFWGYLWDQENLKRRAGFDFRNIGDISVGQLLLTLYNKEGIDGFCNLNGRFVIALWDKAKETLRLIGDRYGFCKLFYWITPGRILFASEYKAIIWHRDFSKKIDEQSIGDFMALGYCLEERTFLKDIKLLPQASIATLERGGKFSIKKYWDYSFPSEEDPTWVEDDYVDQFAALLIKATQRQIDSSKNIALPLSGGYDSRTLAGILNRLHFKDEVKAFSFGYPHASDVVYGRKIAKKVGYEHTYIPIESTYIRDQAQQFVWLMEGTVSCWHAHMLLTFPFIRNNALETAVTGFFGDNICGSLDWLCSIGIRGETSDEDIIKREYAAHADVMNDEDMKIYMKGELYEEIKGKTFETFRSYYSQCPSKNRYFRSRYFSTHERQRRYASLNLYVFDFIVKVISPFLDCEFVDFMCHVPPQLLIFKNLYRKMIVKHLPRVATVPHEDTQLPLNASWIRKGLHWRWEKLNRNLLIRGTIGRRYFKIKWADDYRRSNEAIRTGSRDFVEQMLRDSEIVAEFFHIDKVNEMLNNHFSGKAKEYLKISALLTFAIWARMFVENKKPDFNQSKT
jgi:asparagine synthase (glutamine-hydrolysing)